MPFSDAVGYYSLIVGQAWSTCYEMYFYILMTVILLWGLKKKYILLSLCSFFILFLLVSKIGPAEFTKYGFFRFIYSLAASMHIFKFIAGIIIAIIYQKLSHQLSNNNSLSLYIYKAIWIIIQIAFIITILSKYHTIIAFFMCTLFFMSWLFVDTIWKSDFFSGKTSGILSWLGDISFSIYLIHSIIIWILLKQFGISNLYLLLFFTLLFTIIFSHFMYKYIEKPFINIAKKQTSR